jgi:curli biogenesis system outer membrane secretion channel CsgG
MNTCALALVVVLSATPAKAQESNPPPRPTLTVADFETDRTGWMPPPRLGATLAEHLTDRLVGAGAYRVMDRAWLASPTGESGFIPLPVLIERAQSSGVDYLVVGSVTRLSIEKNSSTRGGIVPIPFVGGLFKKKKTESVIGLTIRLVDVRTGEVVATSVAQGDAAHQTKSGGGLVIVGHVPIVGGAGGSNSSTGVLDRLLDTAVQEAITSAAARLVAAAPQLSRGK